jgi:aldehyde decarbonylase
MLFCPEVERKAQLVMRLTLHLVVQAQQLNRSGELFTKKYPKLRVRLVDGSGLATAVVLKSIPLGTKQVFLSGCTSKVACATAITLCEKGIQVHLSVHHSIQ